MVDEAGNYFVFVEGRGDWVWGDQAGEGIPVVGRVVEEVDDVVELEGEAWNGMVAVTVHVFVFSSFSSGKIEGMSYKRWRRREWGGPFLCTFAKL